MRRAGRVTHSSGKALSLSVPVLDRALASAFFFFGPSLAQTLLSLCVCVILRHGWFKGMGVFVF